MPDDRPEPDPRVKIATTSVLTLGSGSGQTGILKVTWQKRRNDLLKPEQIDQPVDKIKPLNRPSGPGQSGKKPICLVRGCRFCLT